MMVIKRPSERMTVSITGDEDGDREQWTGLDLSGKGIKFFGQGIFQMSFLTHLYMANNDLDRIPSEITQLEHLQILDLSHNKIREIPSELHRLKQLKELLLTHNLLSSLPSDLGRLYQLSIFELRGNPLTEPFLSHINETDKLLCLLLDNAPIPQQPPARLWIYPSSFPSDTNLDDRPSVTAFCYNVLCDKYATRQIYRYCPSWALDWEYRKTHIIKEILTHSSDIISLQEVASKEYHQSFLPHMSKQGYSGIYRAKSRSRTMMNESDKGNVDGCAIFFHNSKYHLLREFCVELQPTCSKYASGCAEMFNRVMPKDNIALCALMESVKDQQQFFVCNLHLTWDPKFRDVKVIQMLLVLKEIESFLKKEGALGIPMLIMGDFNSEHDSGVYELLANGELARDHHDFQGYDYSSFFDAVGLNHPFDLKSAYTEELPYSNYTPAFSGIIDYIWYSANRLTPAALLGPVEESYIKDHVDGCPNAHFPSDHLALSAQFKF